MTPASSTRIIGGTPGGPAESSRAQSRPPEELAPDRMPTSTNSFSEIVPVPEEHRGAIVSGRLIPAERRFRFRYPLNLSVRFRLLYGTSSFAGAGRTVNVSSRGVLVVSQHLISQQEISVPARVEMSIEWPSLLDGRIPLQLFAVGLVLRRGASDFAATFERYQFRTMRSSSQRPARLGGDAVE